MIHSSEKSPDTNRRHYNVKGDIMSPFSVETKLSDDGERWTARIADIPGCHVYASSEADAIEAVNALAQRILAESDPELSLRVV